MAIYPDDNKLVQISYGDDEQIKKLLLGRKIVKVADDQVKLDNGDLVKIVPNVDCCVAYNITDLNDVDNIITRVECVVEDEEPAEVFAGTYAVYVVAEHKKIKAWGVSGDDGNGYYGTGYQLFVKRRREDVVEYVW